jgi:hypothetical protein
MSNCTHCGCNKLSCGCKDSYLTTPPACPTPVDCPAAQPCSETFDSQCIIYTGEDILCGLQTVVQQDDTVAEAIKNIIDYICFKTTVASPILCGTDVVVVSGTPVLGALVSITNYFCTEIANLPTVSILGDNGILVTPVVVGTNTEYTISANGVKKLVKEFTGIEFDSQVITIPGPELIACGLFSPACGVSTTKASDFTFNIMYLFAGNWISITNQAGVIVQANNITGNISITLGLPAVDPPVTVRVTIIG